MQIILTREQAERILADWAYDNFQFGAPLFDNDSELKWTLDTMSQHQVVLKVETVAEQAPAAAEPKQRRQRRAKAIEATTIPPYAATTGTVSSAPGDIQAWSATNADVPVTLTSQYEDLDKIPDIGEDHPANMIPSL